MDNWSWGSPTPAPGQVPKRCLESGVTKDEQLCPQERAQSSFLIPLELIPKREAFPWNYISKGLSWVCTQHEATGRPVVSPQMSQLCRILISPPNLMLIMIKAKQFHSPSSLHHAGILATCPVVHNQPKTMWVSKILLL